MNQETHDLFEAYWLTLALMRKLFDLNKPVAAENLVDTANELRDAIDAQGISTTDYACEVNVTFHNRQHDNAFKDFINGLDLEGGDA